MKNTISLFSPPILFERIMTMYKDNANTRIGKKR